MIDTYVRRELVDLSKFVGFECDGGNDTRNWKKHDVTSQECEEVFFNQPLLLFCDGSALGDRETLLRAR